MRGKELYNYPFISVILSEIQIDFESVTFVGFAWPSTCVLLFVYAWCPISNLYTNHVNRQQFLDPGESVLMISMVKKMQKLTSKKVQLILTNKPKLIYVDPSKLIVKGNIIWSDNPNDLNIQVSSPSNFKICTVSPPCSRSIIIKGIFPINSVPPLPYLSFKINK